eukprot:4832684-Prymnesium_polylepis.1
MRASAAIAPLQIWHRGWRIVRMAAMKKVLSPTSVARMTKKQPRKACTKSSTASGSWAEVAFAMGSDEAFASDWADVTITSTTGGVEVLTSDGALFEWSWW